MNIATREKIVLLGMITQHTVAGHIWAVMHYLEGLRRLGYDVYYVEAHDCSPGLFFEHEDDDGRARAAAYIAGIMERFGLGDRWAYHDVGNGRYFGLSEHQLKELYRSAALLINMHGGTLPLPEHSATGRLVFIDTDPGKPQVNLHHNVQRTLDHLSAHSAWFTYAENYGRPDCQLPVSERFTFHTMRAPVVMDFWEPLRNGVGPRFTTIASWRQPGRRFEFQGDVYHWSKHYEFLKILDLPRLTSQGFELSLSKYDDADWQMLEGKGWTLRPALDFSFDLDAYRRYIVGSRGEFTVSKDQYVRMRTGWFSNRSNTYLASGLPVITQETGFSNVLPTGEGLFGFSTMDEILAAVNAINSDYDRHCRAALAVAREYFSYEVALKPMLAEMGL